MIKRTIVSLFSVYIMISYILHELKNILSLHADILIFIIFTLPYVLMNILSCYYLISSILKKPKDINDNIWMVIASFLGCNLTLAAGHFIELKSSNPNITMAFAGIVLSITAIPFYIAAVINLGKNLTVLPEANTLNTKGIYSISRHPLYSCYIYWYFTNILIYQSKAIIITSIMQAIFQIIRAKNEEKILGKNFLEYADYKKKVWWIGKIKEKQLKAEYQD
jgi:protein-S-isoprenylcysteine O-methyltransferase Ste14